MTIEEKARAYDETLNGQVLPGTHCNLYVESDWFDIGKDGLHYGDKVIVQIRKKEE